MIYVSNTVIWPCVMWPFVFDFTVDIHRCERQLYLPGREVRVGELEGGAGCGVDLLPQ